MQRKVQEQIHEENRDLSREQKIEYSHAAAEAFWREIDCLRKDGIAKMAADNG